MRGMLTIYRREIGSLFAGPLAWCLLFFGLLTNGFMISSTFQSSRTRFGQVDITGTLEYVFGASPLFWALLLILPPLLSMKLLAEESSNGTLEYLRTAPVGDAAVVVGKFLAGLTFMALMWSTLLIYAGGIDYWGAPPDWGQVYSIYIGIVLLSGAFLAISLVPSALVKTPLLAAFLAFLACLLWLTLKPLGMQLLVASRDIFADRFGGYDQAERFFEVQLHKFDIGTHFYRSFFRGIVDTGELIFYCSWMALFLFLTTRTLEARRWQG